MDDYLFDVNDILHSATVHAPKSR